MDFRFTDEQTMVRDLARGILAKEMSPERAKAAEAGASWHDVRLWTTLAEAGLLGIAVDEEYGGMGLGFLELCTLLEEIGRAVAPVHALPALVLAGLPLAAFATAEQKRRWLPQLASGECLLSGALAGEGAGQGGVRATPEGSTWSLSGTLALVPGADVAARVVVPAATAAGFALFLVDPQAGGVTLTPRRTSKRETLFDMTLDRAALEAGDLLGEEAEDGRGRIDWIRDRATVAACALQLGVAESALAATSAYVRERIQFGVPIGSFQAVQHRLADGYIDVQAMRWVTWRAAWRLGQGESALREVAVAKFWAAEGGARVAASAQHLHGGIGVDVDYPIHRYFLWSKSLELAFGSATEQLVTLGKNMAAHPPASK